MLFTQFYLFVAVLGLYCCTWDFSSCSKWGAAILVAMCGLLIAVVSLVAEDQLYSEWVSVIVAHRDQTSVPCTGKQILSQWTIREVLIQFFFLNNLIYFWLCWVFVGAHGLSLAVVSGGGGLLSSCSTQASHCCGFSRCRAGALGHSGFSSCGRQAQQLCLLGSRTQAQQLCHTGLSCSTGYEIFPAQGWNLCLLRWQVDSLPRSHQGSPLIQFLIWDCLRLWVPGKGE